MVNLPRSPSGSAFVVAVALVATLLLASVVHIHANRIPTATHEQPKSKVEYPRFTNVVDPAGNANSVTFLNWARANFITFDLVELDEKGDIIRLAVHICYFVHDKDLQVIAKLPHLEELTFVTQKVTDGGIQQLEATTSLRKLSIHFLQQTPIPNEALERLKSKNPGLAVKS